jgi:hypothetical protein
MDLVSRGDAKQMVRAVRAGSSWEQVRASWPGIDPEWLDANLKGWVLSTAGAMPLEPVAEQDPVPVKRGRRKG